MATTHRRTVPSDAGDGGRAGAGGADGQHRTLADSATAILHEAILTGRLPAGTPLRLNEMADLLGMSMSPVRESIRRLAALGLVEVVQHKGAWVMPLTIEDAVDTHEARIAMETALIERAATRFTAEDARRAEAALDEHIAASARGDATAARRAHTDFHFTIYRAAGSRWLLRGLEPVWENSERYRFATVTPAGQNEERVREHRAILDACVAGDVAAAVSAVQVHIRRAADRVIGKMDSDAAALPTAREPGRMSSGS
ncbi:DNA-binding transcriptional regulator, GntR family [Micromonospora viridifaciens]|uniref:DNA-binding transcriptional regulator, GntR family n=1 Tax=Micromonospora viridifaciens TaxID=1881 RepID=A0A1C4Y2B8_MICVI|nr:GntR family transcriptional regulator [Micromonospora viridifaciens]SCF14872.1 DNA-binding transcriptional regulator, GntR family [Micromonospora viridifaciens]